VGGEMIVFRNVRYAVARGVCEFMRWIGWARSTN
jgi:hypothetical protein